ncbi:MAG: metallophosphoesterase [Deltaproteobacteria bacterium]|uniref:Metallophosphoesterase n=1 Tax=Candidatus Zymogenus saltonus TaxID=2844893 RepID=A0A9D8KHZ7_9DELT|nr:metallophosphoesterase [Candidatus Zymogenus saltonus]
MAGREGFTIFHLSDIHYDGKNVEIFKLALEHLVEFSPQYVFVTGDVVEDPKEDITVPAEMIREALKAVEEKSGISPVFRIVPGNHDLFFMGSYGRKKNGKFFRVFTEEEMGHYFSPEHLLSVFTFDSNQIYEPRGNLWRKFVQIMRPMTHGLIIERDLDEFSDWSRGLKKSENQDLYLKSFKIALVHHHPMPTSYNFLPKLADEGFMMLENAGVVMYRLIQEEFDLILHGHRHVPQFCRAVYFDEDDIEREIAVLGCGSTSKKTDDKIRAVGHNFNVIKVDDNGSVIATQYIKRGTGTFIPGDKVIKIDMKKDEGVKGKKGGGSKKR